MGGSEKKSGQNRKQNDEKKEAIRMRALVNRLYFSYEIPKREIARREGVSREFVKKWTQSPDQDFTMDNRGWEKGRRRKWDQDVEERIVQIRRELEEDPEENYWGPTAVEVTYRKRFPDKQVPPLRTIGQILKDRGMTKDQKHSTKRGALRYLHYPEKSLYKLIGERILEADFIGQRFIKGKDEPIHFLGYSFKKEPRLRHYERIPAQTTDQFIKTTKAFLDRFEVPKAVKMDNDTATIGGGIHPRIISNVMQCLLERGVYPVYSVPRQPATQASIEGSNSLFARKFWNRHEFADLQELDTRLERFNENTRTYLQYEPPEQEQEQRKEFTPKVYFLRQVREGEQGEKGYVEVMNETVDLPREYIKYFVLGEWELKKERLFIRFEKREEDGEEEQIKSEVLKEEKFAIHEKSRERCKDLLR